MSKLRTMIEGVLAIDPSADALEFEKAWQTWGDLARQKDAIDQALDKAGFGKGTRVGVLVRNRAPLVPVLLCLFASDRCLATLNGGAPDEYLAADVRKVEAPVLVGTAQDWARPEIRAAADESGSMLLELTGNVADPVRVLSPGDPARWTRREAPDVAIEMLTSGTTGTPKRIPLARGKFERRCSVRPPTKRAATRMPPPACAAASPRSSRPLPISPASPAS